MKRIGHIVLGSLLLTSFSSCLSKEEKLWNDYEDWREANESWYQSQVLTGKYSKIVPEWNQSLSVSMKWYNDRSKTEGNLTPLYTSTVSVKYKGWLYDGTPFDSSYLQTDSLAELQLNSLIPGWNIAMEQMRVGDWVEVLVPYEAAYGSAAVGKVKPYSILRFEIELRDITAYEIKP